MYLSSKQLFMLLLPLVVSFLIYSFNIEIIESGRSFFPSYKKYSNADLSTKIDNYLDIETKYIIFKDIQDRVKSRKKEAGYLADNLFYREFESIKTGNGEQVAAPAKIRAYKLQAVFPDDKAAIIDELIVKEGSLIHNAKVIKIEHTKVLIKTNEGLKWLFLFQ